MLLGVFVMLVRSLGDVLVVGGRRCWVSGTSDWLVWMLKAV